MQRASSTVADGRVLNPPGGTPLQPYSLPAFLDDLGRLLTALGSDAAGLPCTTSCIDGRLILLHADVLRELAPDARGAVFARKYGGEAATTYGRLFLSVVGFLVSSRVELVIVGLATDGGELAVREEFVEYILNHEVREPRAPIASGAILRFLDEWGHRWI